MKNIIKTLIFAALLTACQENALDRDVKMALASAGDNRAELEAVLNYYRQDTEKYRAAKYLIVNMPGHYSYAETSRIDKFYDSLDSLLNEMGGSSRANLQSAIKDLYLSYGLNRLTTVPDVKVIKSEFLIGNIDRAFNQWKTIPWCRNLDFEQFCELLLPYKVTETQSLTPWWNEYNDIVSDSLDRMSSCSLFRISSFQATEVVNNALRQHFDRDPEDYEIPQLFYRPMTRLRIPFGTCDELCQAGLSAFRATGIPVAMDYVPVWGYGNRGHTWGVVHAPNGKDIPFVPIFMSPYVQHKVNETIAKVYRRTYARNKDLVKVNSSGEWIPPLFRNIFQQDVTARYADVCDLTIKIPDAASKYVYLCTSSRATWKPIDIAEVKHGKASFSNVGKGCVFIVVSYDKTGTQHPLTLPLKLDRDGTLTTMEARQDSLINVRLYRKAPLLEYAWNMAVRIEGGEFEAADNPQFKNPVSVGLVHTPADQAGELDVYVRKYRYWRFIQRGDSARCYIGEIEMQKGGVNLTSSGTAFGNYPKNKEITGKTAFDGNVLSHLSFTHPGEAWVGMDFGKPVSVDKIRYFPRSDGNMIEPGDEYELTYWSDGQWKSLGRKIATTVSIEWNQVPADGVYVLLNRTKGNSVRIFLFNENGEQEWW